MSNCATWGEVEELDWCDRRTPPETSWDTKHVARAAADEWKLSVIEALPATTIVAAIVGANQSLEQRFQEQADIWERDTAFLSATPMRVLHDNYQSIMAMGPDVVPLLLRDLQKTRRHWFWALRHLTQVDPVPEKDRGNLDKMIAAWAEWGRREHKI